MARAKNIREIRWALAENPFYFFVLRRKRLETSNFFSPNSVRLRIQNYAHDLTTAKTAMKLNGSDKVTDNSNFN